MAAHKHAEFIKAWADGEMIQRYRESDKQWIDAPYPSWDNQSKYRIKPAEPERVYPKTRMRVAELYSIYGLASSMDGMPISGTGCDALANAALRHAIDAGQVVAREEVKKRDAEVVLAVFEYLNEWLAKDFNTVIGPNARIRTDSWHIEKVIARLDVDRRE